MPLFDLLDFFAGVTGDEDDDCDDCDDAERQDENKGIHARCSCENGLGETT